MKSHQHYTKPSITEALIDLRVELPADVALASLREMHRSFELDYPTVEEMFVGQAKFQGHPSPTASASQSNVGYRFSSTDQKRILQVRLDGFTFSQLEPYETWEVLRDEAKRLWNIYRSTTQPKIIRRVAVRYINRLDLPLTSGSLDFKDYLQTAPEISPHLPQGLSDYFMQLQIPQQDLQASLVLNEATLPQAQSDIISVLLDIDLFSEVEFPTDSDAMWNLLEKFHDRKNKVFEACITDKTRELLK